MITKVQNEVYLVKGNYSNKIQQSLNEVFATKLLEKLNVKKYVSYDLVKVKCDEEDSIGCRCKSFTSPEVESYSLWQLLKKNSMTKTDDKYSATIKLLTNLGIHDAEEYLERHVYLEIMKLIVQTVQFNNVN